MNFSLDIKAKWKQMSNIKQILVEVTSVGMHVGCIRMFVLDFIVLNIQYLEDLKLNDIYLKINNQGN